MAKKPIPSPVAERPSWPSLAEVTERAVERQNLAPGEHLCGIACPRCQNEISCVPPIIAPTGFDDVQNLKCGECGWTGTMPTSGGYY